MVLTVVLRRDDGSKEAPRTGPVGHKPPTIPTLGLYPSGTMRLLTRIWSAPSSTAASLKSLSSIVAFWWSGGAYRHRTSGLEYRRSELRGAGSILLAFTLISLSAI